MATGIRKYKRKIDQDKHTDFFEKHLGESNLDITGVDRKNQRFLFPFHWVKGNIQYSTDSGSHIQTAAETLRKGQGDCQDQTVLLSNLYLSSGFGVNIVRVSKRGGGGKHVFPMVTPRKNRHEKTAPRRYYKGTGSRYRDSYFYQTIDGKKYYFADTTHCRAIGGMDSLEGKYVSETSSGFKFINQRSSGMIESQWAAKPFDAHKKKQSSAGSSSSVGNRASSASSATSRTDELLESARNHAVSSGAMTETEAEKQRKEHRETRDRIQDLKEKF